MAERYLTVDYIGLVALVVEVFTNASATMIGGARYIVNAGDPAAREFAADAIDDSQGMVLAPILLPWPADHAACCGIRRVSGESPCATNTAIILLAKRRASLRRASPMTAGSCTSSRTCGGCTGPSKEGKRPSATRGTAYGQLDPGLEFLSLAPHGNEGGA
jgi:hypothetical protein